MPKNKAKAVLSAAQVFTDWRYFIGCGFGSGLLPKMPGTWGSMAAIPLAYGMNLLPFMLSFILLLVYFLLCVYVSEKISRDLKIHDFAPVNCDEIFGYLVVMWPFDFTLITAVLAFVLFRFFDIVKPYPISWIDNNIQGGLGMILDDLAAAVASIVSMYFIFLGINYFK